MRLGKLVSEEPNELLRLHAVEYIDFIDRLTQTTNIMDKKFYVAVAFEPPVTSRKGILGGLLGNNRKGVSFTASEWEKFSKELGQRVDAVVNGLSSLGLKSAALDTQKTIEFIYGIYNPDEATTEKLTGVESLEATVVSTQPMVPPPSGQTPALPAASVENKAAVLNQPLTPLPAQSMPPPPSQSGQTTK